MPEPNANATHAIYRHREDENVLLAVRELEEGYEALRVYERPFVLDGESLEANYVQRALPEENE